MSESIDGLLAERGRTHGDYHEHASITQQLKTIMRNSDGWTRLNSCQRETLDMIAHKVGRVLAGNPDFEDHWDDIAGYSRLVSNRIRENKDQSWADERIAAEKIAQKYSPITSAGNL